ncbi:cilia- and flagella-associated protein 43 isoform X2 [Nilaparvata lugens]|uniref:cilia- and flagella-associated protein 43 isoform X2 n=1 Tax=Nilaparvata lugens TaxID=108931 RepID=UPI00193E4C8B|nr:cilia- and flagella-associated protein 43 isoform X2 [Nilaparvata lugens]
MEERNSDYLESDEVNKHYIKWVKPGNVDRIAFVNDDVLAIVCANFILFYNLTTNTESIYQADCDEKGNGIRFVAGYGYAYIFALSDKSLKCRIKVCSYPQFEVITTLGEEKQDDFYVALAFSPSEYLISLTGLPSYEIAMWNWRTGEKLASAGSGLKFNLQTIKFSPHSPSVFFQFARNKVDGHGGLRLWETVSSTNSHKLIPTDIKFNEYHREITSCCWSPDGHLFGVDTTGNIHVVAKDETSWKKLAICKHTSTSDQPGCFQLLWFKGGLLKELKNKAVQHYKRLSPTEWQVSWKLNVSIDTKILLINRSRDCIIGYGNEGELVRIDGKTSCKFIKTFMFKFERATFLYPCKNTLATISENYLTVWFVDTGELVGNLKFESECIYLSCLTETASSESKCIFCVVLSSGVMALLMLEDETHRPIVISFVYLCNERICDVPCFLSDDSRMLATACFNTGKLFTLTLDSEKMSDGNSVEVANFVDIGTSIQKAKFSKDAREAEYFLIVLKESDTTCDSKFVIFNTKLETVANIIMHDCQVVDFIPGFDNKCYMAIQGSIMIHVVHFQYEEERATTVSKVDNGHRMRGFHFSSFQNDVLSFGWDGLILVIDQLSGKVVETICALYRFEDGINYAISDGDRRHILVISKDSSLVCYQLNEEMSSESKPMKKSVDSPSKDIVTEMAKPSYVYPPGGNFEKTWLNLYMHECSVREMETCEFDITFINRHLAELKNEIRSMLDDNMNASDEERLDIEEFQLDWEMHERRKSNALAEQDQLRQSYLDQINEYNGMTSKIVRNCWDAMHVKTRRIKAIEDIFSVENYGQLPKNADIEAELKKVQTLQRIQVKYKFGERFFPWLEQSSTTKHKCRTISEEDRLKIISMVNGQDSDKNPISEQSARDAIEVAEIGRRFELSGASSWKFVDIPEQLVSQMTFTSHIDTCVNFIMFELVLTELQDFFNKKFDEAFAVKEREVDEITRCNNRLREIHFEMEHACKNPTSEDLPTDPKFFPVEKPSKIITVDDSEVPVEPYVSPSELQLRAERHAEEERQRLLLLADNFRELALMEMMDGVLEIRWEDELKKEVDLPKCMKTKDPEDFDENDLKTVMEYEKQCEFLNSERERYRKMLVQEYNKLKDHIADSILKFDHYLLSILHLKIAVDAAINHEMLKMTKSRLNCYRFTHFDEKEIELARYVREVERESAEQLRQLELLRESEAAVQAAHEQTVARDKQMERRFKSELINYNLTPIVLDHLTKQFKRRPKVMQVSAASPQLLYDVAKCVRNPELQYQVYLPSEYHDFLKSLDNYDSFSNAPANFDENVWKVFVQVRRNKVENEFKVKASALEVADSEKMVARAISAMQSLNEEAAHSKLRSLREERTKFNQNFQVQLVLKQGQVELQTSGQISDFDDCVLVDKSLVEDINNLVKQAGASKLKVMLEAANFHRGIIFKEWEHKMLRMRIEDLKHELQQIDGVRVTRYVKKYLKKVERFGEPTLEDLIAVNKDVPALKMIQACHERAVKDLKLKQNEVEKEFNEMEQEGQDLDNRISSLNDEVTELHIQRDLEFECSEQSDVQRRMNVINRRGRLTEKINETNKELAILQTELEILRMRTYPTLRHRSLI